MQRRVLSLFLCRWPTDRLHRRPSGAPSDAPLATAATIGNRRILLAVDQAASLAGLTPGLTVADARAREPGLTVVEADPAGDAAALEALADWCGRFSPWTAVSGEDGVWLDITGCVPLLASEQALADELLMRLRRQGIACRVAVADTPGGAWAMARYGARSGPSVVVPPGEIKAALQGLPAAALRLPGAVVHDLRRLGLRRIGELYDLPRAPLTPRFGEIVARRLDQALGRVEEPISPRPPVEALREQRNFAEPLQAAEDLHRAMHWLVNRLCQRLERDGLGARRLELAFYRVDARVERIAIGTSRPSRDLIHLAKLLAAKIEEVDPGLGIEIVTLSALEADALAARQSGLLVRDSGNEQVAPLIDRLANRLGAENVMRLIPRASHVPERAMRRVSALEPAPDGSWPVGRQRPLRLLARPDPVDVMAPVPDEPPLQFRWRRIVHRVRHAEGPERIAAEWWRQVGEATTGDIRDYYRVEDEAGRRYWLYRQGLYRPEAPPRWFLHGFFP